MASESTMQELIKQFVPPTLTPQGTVTILRNPESNAEIVLIGTSHDSKECGLQVENIIRATLPDVVFVELCHERAASSLRELEEIEQLPDSAQEDIRDKYGLYDMHIALREAKRVESRIIAGDIPWDSTKKRLQAKGYGTIFDEKSGKLEQFREISLSTSLSAAVRSSLFFFLPETWQLISIKAFQKVVPLFGLKTPQIDNRNISRISRRVLARPTVDQIVIEERDEFMVQKLRNLHDTRIVAVVGLGHLDGIEARWAAMNAAHVRGETRNRNFDFNALTSVPTIDSKPTTPPLPILGQFLVHSIFFWVIFIFHCAIFSGVNAIYAHLELGVLVTDPTIWDVSPFHAIVVTVGCVSVYVIFAAISAIVVGVQAIYAHLELGVPVTDTAASPIENGQEAPVGLHAVPLMSPDDHRPTSN